MVLLPSIDIAYTYVMDMMPINIQAYLTWTLSRTTSSYGKVVIIWDGQIVLHIQKWGYKHPTIWNHIMQLLLNWNGLQTGSNAWFSREMSTQWPILSRVHGGMASLHTHLAVMTMKWQSPTRPASVSTQITTHLLYHNGNERGSRTRQNEWQVRKCS